MIVSHTMCKLTHAIYCKRKHIYTYTYICHSLYSPDLFQLPYFAVLVLPSMCLLCVLHLESCLEPKLSLEAVPGLQFALSSPDFLP